MKQDSRSSEKAGADVLEGGGEMGERMRRIDWSQTPLGQPERWPQSLKTAVRIMLTSRQPMFVWWGDDLINLYNDPYKAIVGGKHPGALGLPASIVWREIWDQVGPRAESAMLKNEGTYDESLRLIMERNGYPEETYYTFSYSPIPNDAGGTGGILCANTDDTQRIIGERQMNLLRILASKTADARSVAEACTASAACLETDPYDFPFALLYRIDTAARRGVLSGTSGLRANHPAAPETVSLDHDAPWPFDAVVDEHAPRLISDLQRSFATLPCGPWSMPPGQAVVVPIMLSGHKGQPIVLVAGLNPFRVYDDQYRGFVDFVAAQIAAALANANAYEEERQRAEALTELDRAKTVFFSNVSHEFRTPLTLMLGPIDEILAKPEGQVLPENRELLTVAKRSAQRLLKLVNTLLDFSRIEAGRIQAVYEPVDLAVYTADLASVFRAAIEKAGMQLVIDCPPLRESVFVDRDLWEKIILNLLSNAFKYTLTGEISVSIRSDDDRAVLRVRDTGVGIPAQELPKVFDRFHRVEGTVGRTHEGTGIGLALVQELVKLHGGTISADSVLGQGSIFTVCVPFGQAHLPANQIGAIRASGVVGGGSGPFLEEAIRWLPDVVEERQAATAQADGGLATPQADAESQPRILLADDNADMLDYVRRVLMNVGYDVVTARHGAEALDMARLQPPDLVLSDVMMPHLDGLGLAKELRADYRTRDIPIILLSARAGEEATVHGLEQGADDYLTKPFSSRELLARVGQTLSSARARRIRSAAVHEEMKTLEILNRVGKAVSAELDLERVVQIVTDAATELSGAAFGAFFYNQVNADGESYWLYALSGASRNAFGHFPMPRNTEVFSPTFRGEGLVRSDDITKDPRYGKNAPYRGMPPGHIPVRSYLAAPVVSRTGEVIGGLFFGHPESGVFSERAERLISGIASQAAIAIDNAKLYRHATEEIAERAKAEAALAQADRRKDEFLATLAHELRNPLAPIRNALQIMSLAGGNIEILDRARAMMDRQVLQMVRLIDDLMDVSRINRGTIDLRKERMDLAAIVGTALETSRPLIDELRHRLTVTLPERPVLIEADPIRLSQVFANLLNNAAKYTDPGGQIELVVREKEIEVDIVVRDNGLGIPSDMLQLVFELFAQVERSLEKTRGGLGIGLTIVRQLVEMHGGRVEARSDGPGKGSEFVVTLPVVTTTADASSSENDRREYNQPSSRRRIVVADDNEDSAISLAMMLTIMGHEVRAVHDGREAIEVAAASRPDVVILDIGMAKLNGYDTCRLIKAQPWAKKAVLIAVTGWGQEEDRRRSREAGFDYHLVKPVDPSMIATLLSGL